MKRKKRPRKASPYSTKTADQYRPATAIQKRGCAFTRLETILVQPRWLFSEGAYG